MIAVALAIIVIVAPVAVAISGQPGHRCGPVPYVLDARLGPPRAAELVKDVFDEIEVMSGIRFVPAKDGQRANAPVRLAWVQHAASSAWDVLQLGRSTDMWGRGDGVATVVSGELLFRSALDAEHILQGPVDWYTVARHEVGHLLGLPHQTDPSDVMYPTLTDRPQSWTSTDRAHLTARGHAAGCRPGTSATAPAPAGSRRH